MSLDLLRFHVPLLLIAPNITQAYGQTIATVAIQLDVIPTILGLLGKPYKHQCWERDILSLPQSDKGFAVIKPSGSNQIVALLTGDNILVKQPNVSARLGQYTLTPKASYQVLPNPSLKNTMEKQLLSFIETAILALHNKQAGIDNLTVFWIDKWQKCGL